MLPSERRLDQMPIIFINILILSRLKSFESQFLMSFTTDFSVVCNLFLFEDNVKTVHNVCLIYN